MGRTISHRWRVARRVNVVPGMSRTSMVALVLAASASAASAGPYFGLGLGSSAELDGKLTQFSDAGRSYRLFGGYRFIKYLSLEGSISRFGEVNQGESYDATSAAAVVKGSLPIANGFEAYGRVGLQHTWLETDSTYNDFEGTGYLLGLGFEYRFKTRIGGGSVFADYQRLDATMSPSGNGKSGDQGIGLWTLGVALEL